jgi:predicted transcriptional regulator of viral defense system
MRLSEFTAEGITAATVSRLEKSGALIRVARGLYQHPDMPTASQHSLAQAAKLVTNGVICLTSALAYHGLTDQLPARVWIAIGRRDWLPKQATLPWRFVRFSENDLVAGIECVQIDGIDVRITSVVRTIVDLFRYRRKVGETIALEGLRNALRDKRVTPAEIARLAVEKRMWTIMRPILEALTIDG